MSYSSYRTRSPLRLRNESEVDRLNQRRIYVADLDARCTRAQIEYAFARWPVEHVWHAQASCFAFVILRHRHDVAQAISELDGR
jgi:hypothetical protein